MIKQLKRETTTTYETNGRTFEIRSYDPMEGNYILYQIVSFVLPFGIGKMLSSKVGGSEMIPTSATSEMKTMSKEDFINLQRDILRNVYEVYPSGESSPVVRDNGSYGIMDFTIKLSINLIVASLAFNFKDFFIESQSIEGQ